MILCPHIPSDLEMIVCATTQLQMPAQIEHVQALYVFFVFLLVFSINTFLQRPLVTIKWNNLFYSLTSAVNVIFF